MSAVSALWMLVYAVCVEMLAGGFVIDARLWQSAPFALASLLLGVAAMAAYRPRSEHSARSEGTTYSGPWAAAVTAEEVVSKYATWEPAVLALLKVSSFLLRILIDNTRACRIFKAHSSVRSTGSGSYQGV